MFKEYFILLLLGHIVGDFYLQTGKMAERKEKSIKWVFIHCFYYGAMMMLVSLSIISTKLLIGAVAASLFHMIIDIVKYNYLSSVARSKKKTQVIERNIFFVDQVLHIVCLIFIAYWLVATNSVIKEWKVVENFFDIIGISEVLLLSWIVALLLIHKPGNIAIQKMLLVYKPESKEVDKRNDNSAGKFIGTVERIIMLIFLSIGQYSSIGLVLTAKSIARYDRISKEKNFAEYYLLGTLLSTVLVIIVSFVLLK